MALESSLKWGRVLTEKQHARRLEIRKKDDAIYREKNRKKRRENDIKYSKTIHYKVHKKAWKKIKLKTDPNFKLRMIIHSRVWQAIKKGYKSAYAIVLLGCSIEEARAHIEKQFKPGMTWQNHGLYGWHLDHIRPCCSFNLLKPEEQRICFHYSNLQPLWAQENLIKGGRTISL